MDKISKFLGRLSAKEFVAAEEVIAQIVKGELQGLDVKKLKGHDIFFRARKGQIRIIFSRKDDVVRIVAIERRNEKTYKGIK